MINLYFEDKSDIILVCYIITSFHRTGNLMYKRYILIFSETPVTLLHVYANQTAFVVCPIIYLKGTSIDEKFYYNKNTIC